MCMNNTTTLKSPTTVQAAVQVSNNKPKATANGRRATAFEQAKKFDHAAGKPQTAGHKNGGKR